MTTTTPCGIAGRPASGTDVLEVRSPFDGALAGTTTNATAEHVEAAVAVAHRVRAECAATSAHVRASASDHVSRRFGVQAGVFTRDLQPAFRAAQVLEVRGEVVGDVPRSCADQMPDGGVKDSGTGREGVHSATEDLTGERVLVLTGIDL